MDNLGYVADSGDSDDEEIKLPDIASLCFNPYR